MSILIKGMQMPFSCTECPLAITEQRLEYIDEDSQKIMYLYNCLYKPEDIEDGWARFSKVDSKRQDWCPLVELPKHHGKLIDEQEIRNGMNRVLTQPQRPTWDDVYNAIEEMNATIEAE